MIRRVLASVGLSAAIAVVATLPVLGQGGGATAPPLVITAYNGGQPIPYTTPKTPWGDPLPKLSFRDAPVSVELRGPTEEKIRSVFAEMARAGGGTVGRVSVDERSRLWRPDL